MRFVIYMMSLAALGSIGCAAEGWRAPAGEAVAELGAPPRICPAIAILCIEGYTPKSLPNCNQICVPDNTDWECDTDSDCGAIYCFTTPCEQPVCRGHQCLVGAYPPAAGGEPCGDIVCGATTYCCNASCGICAPLDGGCIQIACIDDPALL